MRKFHDVVGVLAIALALPGCGTQVIGGSGEGGSDTAGGGYESNAVAMRFSQWTLPPSSPLFNFAISTAPPDPDALVLFYASEAQACGQPHIDLAEPSTDPAVCAEQAFWQTIVVIPPDRAQPGSVIDLSSDLSLTQYWGTWREDCSGGGGLGPGVIPGTLTISSIDATEVVAKLDLAPGFVLEGQSGDYTATFCP